MLTEPLPLEIQHDVDHVLEGAWSGDRALLGDVPDKEHGDAGCFGHLAHAEHRGPNLRDASRRPGSPGISQRLHRVDHHERWAFRLDRGDHRVDVGLDEQANPGTGATKPPSSQGKLL